MLMREITEADAPKKTKTRGGSLADLLAAKPDTPPAKRGTVDPKDSEKARADVPDMPRATADKTSRDTMSMTPTDAMRDMMSRMRAPDDDLDLDDDDVLPEPSDPANLPAVITRQIAKTDPDAIRPDWHVVANLPANIQRPIMQLGRSLFGSFTRTPTRDITMIGNIAGQGPNRARDVAGVMDWIRRNAKRVDTARIDFDQTIPGYDANVTQHTTGGIRFLVVRDQFGEYVYAWPEADSLDAQGQIPGAVQARLNEAGGPWDPNRPRAPNSNILNFPQGGKGGAAGQTSVPKVQLPKPDPSKLKGFMSMAGVKSLVGMLLKKLLPIAGTYWWGSSALDFAKQGRWRDMFISLGGAGLNLASVLGFAAGGVGGFALGAAEVAAALYTYRIDLIRMYYTAQLRGQGATEAQIAEVMAQYTDEMLYEYADYLTGLMADYIVEELKAAATEAYRYATAKQEPAKTN